MTQNRQKTVKTRLYIAYGSNLNLDQMARRCPTSEIVGTTFLRNWRLRFRGDWRRAVATIERQRRCRVPILVWRLQPEDEQALDIYEGFPYLYRKQTVRITLDGKRVNAFTYIMNEFRHPYNKPSVAYLSIVREGYRSIGFDTELLRRAVEENDRH